MEKEKMYINTLKYISDNEYLKVNNVDVTLSEVINELLDLDYIYFCYEDGYAPYVDFPVYKITRKGLSYLNANHREEEMMELVNELRANSVFNECAFLYYLGTISLETPMTFEDYRSYCMEHDHALINEIIKK